MLIPAYLQVLPIANLYKSVLYTTQKPRQKLTDFLSHNYRFNLEIYKRINCGFLVSLRNESFFCVFTDSG